MTSKRRRKKGENMPRYTVDLADQMIKDLDKFAESQCISRAEALKRALALLQIANTEREAGNELGVIRRDKDSQEPRVISRIAGV
jgi:metal-responsive CopG/Arc/MetJ family transcriptional regulator